MTEPETDPESETAPELTLLTVRDGLPDVTDTSAAIRAVSRSFAHGQGSVAVDAERASGYRYSQRAYLVQLRRVGAGTALVDPIGLDQADLDELQSAIGDQEWVLHAASQDLECLAEIGLRPPRLFDTELAGRLLGHRKVGLATMVADYLGFELLKEHSAADWSTRPLPEPWLQYAALDVEVLLELRDAVADALADAGKTDWAAQEFEAIRTAPPKDVGDDPWRRTSGIHHVRHRRKLAIVRSLWQARDALARERDIAPGRLLRDAAIIEAASQHPADQRALAALPTFRSRARRELPRWWRAVQDAEELPEAELPGAPPRGDSPPPPRAWKDKNPDAAERLKAVRALTAELAEHWQLPVENLAPPDAIRRLCWDPPNRLDADSIAAALSATGVRPWQIELLAPPIAAELNR